MHEVEATVGRVCAGERGSFAVAYPAKPYAQLTPETPVTFSLADWEGNESPLKGQIVLLRDVERFVKGWRARHARPVRAEDSNKQEGARM